jgi:hypothetical protein
MRSENLKEAGRHMHRCNLLWFARAGQRVGKLLEVDPPDGGEEFALGEGLYFACTYEGALVWRRTIVPPKHHDAVCVRIWERLKQCFVRSLKHGQYGADA